MIGQQGNPAGRLKTQNDFHLSSDLPHFDNTNSS